MVNNERKLILIINYCLFFTYSQLDPPFTINKCTTLLYKLLIWPTEDQIMQMCDYLKIFKSRSVYSEVFKFICIILYKGQTTHISMRDRIVPTERQQMFCPIFLIFAPEAEQTKEKAVNLIISKAGTRVCTLYRPQRECFS